MKAEEYLQQIEKIDCIILNKLREREQWEDMAKSITSQMGGERVQSSGSKEKMANAVVEVVEIDKQIQMYKDLKKEVISVIERLNVKEYDFAHKVYVQHLTLREVAKQEGKSYTWATNMNKAVKRNVQTILDGRG